MYRSTPPICNAVPRWLQSFGERETPQYTSNLCCSRPPICTAARLPFAPAMLLRKYRFLYNGGTDSLENFAAEFSASAPLVYKNPPPTGPEILCTTGTGEGVKVSVAIFCPSGGGVVSNPVSELLRKYQGSQRALRDRLMSRSKNCLPAVSRQSLTHNCPRPNCLLKCLPNCLSPTRDGFLSSFKINPAVRVIVRQVRDKNRLAAIFAPRHQSVSSGPLGWGFRKVPEFKQAGRIPGDP